MNKAGFMALLFGSMLAVACSGLLHAQPVFIDDFEGDVSGWSTNGFWHHLDNPQNIFIYNVGGITPNDPPDDINPDLVTLPDTFGSGKAYLGSAHSVTHVFWYGVDYHGTFIDDTADPHHYNQSIQSAKNGGLSNSSNDGSLVSPGIDLNTATEATLYFWTWWEIEGVDADDYDMMYVEISTDGGSNFTTIGTLNPLNDVNNAHDENYSSGGSKATPVWVRLTFDISSYTGNTVKIRFRFRTVDERYNGFRGWMIDDVRVSALGQPAPVVENVDPDCVENSFIDSRIVDVHGQNFVHGASVTVGGTAAAAVSVISSNLIQIKLPNTLGNGTYGITVTNPDTKSHTLPDCITIADVCEGPEEIALLVRQASNDLNIYFWNAPVTGDWTRWDALARNPSPLARDFWQIPVGNDGMGLTSIDISEPADGRDEIAILVRQGLNDLNVYFWNAPVTGDWIYFDALARNPSPLARDFWQIPIGNDGIGLTSIDISEPADGRDEIAILVRQGASDLNIYFWNAPVAGDWTRWDARARNPSPLARDFWQIPLGNYGIGLTSLDLDYDGRDELGILVKQGLNDLNIYFWNAPVAGDWTRWDALARNPSPLARDFWQIPIGNDGIGLTGIAME